MNDRSRLRGALRAVGSTAAALTVPDTHDPRGRPAAEARTMTFPTGRCDRCERYPVDPASAGKLFLWFPQPHGRTKVGNALRRAQRAVQPGEDGESLVVPVLDGIDEALDGACATLTDEELDDTRVLFLRDGSEPTLRDFGRITTLRLYLTLRRSGWLVDMLAEQRFTSLFQPIVAAADPARVVGQEALLRGVDGDGGLVPAGRVIDQARDAGLLFQLDLTARRTAIREAYRAGLDGLLFINFAPTAIYDPAFCLRSTVRAIDEAGIPHGRVVFEVVESDRTKSLDHLRAILTFYRDAGFRIALDDVGAGYSGLNLIHQLRPDFIKLDMELTRGVHADPYKATIAGKILEIARSLGITTVAEGIETPEELAWVAANGADLAQGYLIGRPTAYAG